MIGDTTHVHPTLFSSLVWALDKIGLPNWMFYLIRSTFKVQTMQQIWLLPQKKIFVEEKKTPLGYFKQPIFKELFVLKSHPLNYLYAQKRKSASKKNEIKCTTYPRWHPKNEKSSCLHKSMRLCKFAFTLNPDKNQVLIHQ